MICKNSNLRKNMPKIFVNATNIKEKQPFIEPKLRFIEPKLTKRGDFVNLTEGFFGPFTPPSS